MVENSSDIILHTLVADDEPIARLGMQRLVQHVHFLRLAGVARNAAEITRFLEKEKIDLLFLDIQMPGVTGVDYIKSLADPPLVIFTTAFAEYAIEGYEVNALDYLLKPISLERFIRAANKAKEQFELRLDHLSREGVPI